MNKPTNDINEVSPYDSSIEYSSHQHYMKDVDLDTYDDAAAKHNIDEPEQLGANKAFYQNPQLLSLSSSSDKSNYVRM
jgi:hypothetical protein